MSAKITNRRRGKFVQFLAESGNVSLSAERAKVSRSWVRLQRATDDWFEAACLGALGVARDRLGDHATRKPATGWGFLDGAELVVR